MVLAFCRCCLVIPIREYLLVGRFLDIFSRFKTVFFYPFIFLLALLLKLYTFILNRIVPNLRIINVILLMIFGVCLWKIHFLVDKPYILSGLKMLDFATQRFFYKCLLNCLFVFNLWLVFYPICRSIYIYRALLKLEVIDFSFDLLLIFASFTFT